MQTQAREDWTQPVALSEYERVALSKDLVLRISGLANAPKSTKVGFAIEMLDEGRRKGVTNLRIYQSVLKQLLSTCTYSETGVASKNLELILERMREDGLEPDLKTYNHILDCHASVHNHKEAAEVYDEMLERGVEPDRRTASHMIVAHSRGNDDDMYRAVDKMYAKGWKGSRAAYLAMIAVMGKRKDYDGVFDTFRRMREELKKPTEATCFVVFRAAEDQRQVETAKQVFDYRIEVGLPPQEYPYVKMMLLLMKEGRPDDSLDYWRRLVCVNGLNGVAISHKTYNLAIKCATRAGNLEELEAVVEMMETQGIGPTETAYVSALSGFERPYGAPCMAEAERAFARIAKTAPPPGTSVQQRQAVAYAHAGMWQKAFDLFHLVLAETTALSARDWKCVLMSQFELGKYAEMKATWTLCTERRNTSHSYKTFEYALKAASMLEDADWALQVREVVRNGDKRSVDLEIAVVDVLLKAGRLEEARAILKELEALGLTGPKLEVLQRSYEVALAICEKRGYEQLALQFLDGMRSTTPPLMPNASCPSFAFLLKALKDNGRAEEVQPVFDDVCASSESVGESGAISYECSAIVAEAEELCRGRAATSQTASCSAEGGFGSGFGEDDHADAGPSPHHEDRETGESETVETPSPKAEESA
eukprot:g13065.t2